MTHNVHGPHDDSFYKYLAVLESEYEDLRRSGYSGEGFHSRGTRLGVGTSHNLPPHLARFKALEAAEKRRAGGSGGGRRLGGRNVDGGWSQLTPGQLALRVSLISCPPFGFILFHPPNITERFRWDSLLILYLFSPLLLVFFRLPKGGNTTTPLAHLGQTLRGKLTKPQKKASKAKSST